MSELTLHFGNAQEAQDVLGGGGIPRRIEKTFGVKLTVRDTWVKLDGEEKAVNRATRCLDCLRRARTEMGRLQRHTILYALKAFQDGRENEIEEMYAEAIPVGPGKSTVFPRTFGQRKYLEAIDRCDICFGVGPAGTGKTYLAMAMAVSSLIEGKVNRIILTRPAVEAGEALGFLPGDLHDKVQPYLRPLHDALYDMMDPETIERHMDRGIIEVAPLAYMRGRTLNNAFVILDEAQNTTQEQMMMFLTRMGFGSKCVITGDPTQVDLPRDRDSGLVEASRILQNIPGLSVITLHDDDVVRHELVQKIIQAYRENRPGRKPTSSHQETRS